MNYHRTRKRPTTTNAFQNHVSSSNKPVNASVKVENNDIEKALRTLKKTMQQEGVWRTFKQQARYEKPSEEKKRKENEAIKRSKKRAVADFARRNGISKQEARDIMKEMRLKR